MLRGTSLSWGQCCWLRSKLNPSYLFIDPVPWGAVLLPHGLGWGETQFIIFHLKNLIEDCLHSVSDYWLTWHWHLLVVFLWERQLEGFLRQHMQDSASEHEQRRGKARSYCLSQRSLTGKTRWSKVMWKRRFISAYSAISHSISEGRHSRSWCRERCLLACSHDLLSLFLMHPMITCLEWY